MKLALSSRWFAPGTSLETAARRTREFGLEHLVLHVPGAVAPGSREAARSVGVSVCAVVNDGNLDAAVALASTQRSPFVVVEGGTFEDERVDRALRQEESALCNAVLRGDAPDATALLQRRAATVEEVAVRAARALHAALRGTPLALRNAGTAADLLLEPTTLEWLLSDLPRLGFFFDPARALRAHRLGLGPQPAAWADRFGSRTGGVFVHGLGSDLAGHSHPEDGAPEWRLLAEELPRGIPWILDLAPSLAPGDVEDAIRYVESAVGGG